jgi:hypothetical protein
MGERKRRPGLPPFGCPALLDWSGFLINSHDPLRGHVLKHIRQNSLTSLRYSAAHRGEKQKTKTANSQGGQLVARPWFFICASQETANHHL